MSVRPDQQRHAAVRRLLEDDIRDSPAELLAILNAVSDGIIAQDPTGAAVYANDAAARLCGFGTAEEFLAAPRDDVRARFEILDEQRRPLSFEELPGREALLGRAEERTVCYRLRATGEERWSLVSAEPVFGADGSVKLAINTIHDLTDRMQASEHVRLLGDTSALLAASLDFEETLVRVADLLVPGIADYALVDLVEDDGAIRPVLMRHVIPEQEELLREIRDRFPPGGNAGHPVTRVLTSGEPLLIEVADTDVLRAAAVDDEHLRLYERLQPASYIVVPCVARGRTVGTLSLGTGVSGRRYTAEDVAFARVVGGRIALAADNARLYREASESFALLDTLLVSAPVGIGFWDRELRFVRLNDALSRLNELPIEDHLGKTLAEVIPEIAPGLEPLYRQVLETGRPVTHEETIGTGGSERQWISSYYPVRAATGKITGVGAVIMEVTAQRRADQRLRLLAEAGALFSSSLDPQEIFERVARVVVPRFAESCNIYVAQGESLERAAYAHADPELEPVVASLPHSYPIGEGSTALMARVFSRGKPILVPTLTPEFIDNLESLGVQRDAFAKIGTQSMIFVPLVARGEALGVMTMGSRIPGRFDETDLELGEEIGRRAAVAIENARLYAETEARAQASQALQFVRDGVFLLDADQVVRLWNPAAERITGLSEAEMLGRHASEVLASWPLEQVGERGQTLPIEVGTSELWLSTHRVRVPAGHRLRLPRPDGGTGARAAEERLRLDRLARAADAAGGHLRCGDDAPARRRGARRRAARGHAGRGRERVRAPRADRQRHPLGEPARLGRRRCRDRALDAREVAARSSRQRGRISRRRSSSTLRAPDGLPPVAADPDKVRQVLVNLVDNAIKYSPDGGPVEVSVEAVRDRCASRSATAGLGIPAAEHDRIFEKFYRLDPNLTRGVGGTGLGLYICRELVRRMDGRIWVESEPGGRLDVLLRAAARSWVSIERRTGVAAAVAVAVCIRPGLRERERRPKPRLETDQWGSRADLVDVGGAPPGRDPLAAEPPHDDQKIIESTRPSDADDHQDDADRVDAPGRTPSRSRPRSGWRRLRSGRC